MQKTVAFIGFPHARSPGGIRATGTAFFVQYEQQGYIVTARHCVESDTNKDTLLRVNTTNGSQLIRTPTDATWTYHENSSVDVAAIPAHLPLEDGFDCQYISKETLLTQEDIANLEIDVGCLCYTVGLFRYIYGHERNLPLVYTGSIALMSESYIPGWDPIRAEVRQVWGCLIQTAGIHGASGSPVFVRRSLRIGDDGLLYESRVRLFGILTSAWFLPPDETLRAEFGAKPGDTVPVGLGVVVQSPRIIEVIETIKANGD